MKIFKNQKGALDLMLVFALIFALAAGGFVYYRINSSNEDIEKLNSNEYQEPEHEQTEEQPEGETGIPPDEETEVQPEEEPTVTEPENTIPSYSLISPADTKDLPSNFPQSFRDYMSSKLKKNSPDKDGCRIEYHVSLINKLNIRGGFYGTKRSSASEPEENGAASDCMISGAPFVWYLYNGKWQQADYQGAKCEDIKDRPVYSEALPHCIGANDYEDNPNGSYKDAH